MRLFTIIECDLITYAVDVIEQFIRFTSIPNWNRYWTDENDWSNCFGRNAVPYIIHFLTINVFIFVPLFMCFCKYYFFKQVVMSEGGVFYIL